LLEFGVTMLALTAQLPLQPNGLPKIFKMADGGYLKKRLADFD